MMPEQMRALVDFCVYCARTFDQCRMGPGECCFDCQHRGPLQTALREAANELDAVLLAVKDKTFTAFDGEKVVYSELVMDALSADTGSREASDD